MNMNICAITFKSANCQLLVYNLANLFHAYNLQHLGLTFAVFERRLIQHRIDCSASKMTYILCRVGR